MTTLCALPIGTKNTSAVRLIMKNRRLTVVKKSLEVLSLVESDGAVRVNGRDLVHIKDLHVVPDRFRSNDGEVVEYADFTPRGADRILSWQTSEVGEFPPIVDLYERGASVLPDSYGCKLPQDCTEKGSGLLKAICLPFGLTQPWNLILVRLRIFK